MFCTLCQVIALAVCSVYIALLSLKFLGIQKLCVMLLDILHSFTINKISFFERTSQKKRSANSSLHTTWGLQVVLVPDLNGLTIQDRYSKYKMTTIKPKYWYDNILWLCRWGDCWGCCYTRCCCCSCWYYWRAYWSESVHIKIDIGDILAVF